MRRIYCLICFLLIPAFSQAGLFDDNEMVLDLDDNWGFYAQGFPTDFRRNGDHIKVHDFPRPLQLFSLTYSSVAARADWGYSPALPMYMRFGKDFA